MTSQHFLIVHEDPDDGMEIEHPDGCPTVEIYGGRAVDYDCPVGRMDALMDWFRRTDVPSLRSDAGLVPVAPGRYVIEYWNTSEENPPGDDRFDEGICLADGAS